MNVPAGYHEDIRRFCSRLEHRAIEEKPSATARSSDHQRHRRIRLLGEQVRMLIETNTLALDEAEQPDRGKP